MAVILYCRMCNGGYGSTGDIPAICPLCNRETKWGTSPRGHEPVPWWVPNENDRRLLRSLRIDPE
ncbi:MAG TPA: hypothetical protein VF491_17780 [Vicinamibacterales bacterium]